MRMRSRLKPSWPLLVPNRVVACALLIWPLQALENPKPSIVW